MGGFSTLNDYLGYVDGTQEVEWNFFHAGIGKNEGKGSGIMHITYISLIFWAESFSDSLV